MRCSGFTNLTRLIAGLLVGLLFAILVVPLNAQTAGDSHVYYDVTQEVTLSGTVSAVLVKPAPGMIMGSHLLLATISGQVDASLGNWALQGKGALSVTPGQQVEVTGVMKTLNHKQVFIARTVKAGGKVYTMRNEHGIPVSPQARELATRKGESL
jgi:hypothetical protein